ncbi:protein kinase activating protein dpb11 [Pleosporales sp. CAS-2024a]
MAALDGAYRTATSNKPLTGAVLCCTSIAPEQRTHLAHIGADLGATIKLDLTSDVTHLIVGSIDSAKYRYVARCREDVKVLSPAWLEALREVWLQGSDHLDVAALEAAHRVPTFFGLKICLTGFDTPEQRRYIQETADQNGAEYHGDLTKAVTHLIAAAPSGKKYEHAVNWSMKIVSLEWFQHSLERGMVLDEASYHPTLPLAERGQGAWDRRQRSSPAPGKRSRESEPSQALDLFRRKLRRSASTRLGSQSAELWAGITAGNVQRRHDDADDWTEELLDRPDTPREHTPATRLPEATVAEHVPDADPAYNPCSNAMVSRQSNAHLAQGIFGGRVVFPHGFNEEKTAILRQHLQDQGARVPPRSEIDAIPEDHLRNGFLVVPHDVPVDLTCVPDRAGSMLNLVTNWWVERCLYGKRLVDPAGDILSRPFDIVSISGFSSLTINSTAFVGIELLHVTKVVALLGATYDEQLSAKTSVIVCNTREPNAQKLKFATERRIPAVHATWLWDCLRYGQLQSYSKYQLNNVAPIEPQKAKSNHQTTSTKLSTDENFEGQHKLQTARKTTKPKGPQKPQQLELMTCAEPTPDRSADLVTHIDPHVGDAQLNEEHETLIPVFDGSASIPLQDVSANPPRRPSTTSLEPKLVSRERSSSAESLIRPAAQRKTRPARQPTPDSVIPADTEPPAPPPPPPEEVPAEKDYSDILAQLRANRKPVPSAVDAHASTRRRGRRQLGRATSTRSNDSTAADSSGQLNLNGDDDREQAEAYQPSQELGWDSPGAAKAREQMIKRLGGKVTETSVRVEGIGVVRDAASEGAGGRVARKKREKGF